MKRPLFFLITSVVATIFLAGCMPGGVKIDQPTSASSTGVMIKISEICLMLTPCANQNVTFARLADNGDILSDELYQAYIMKSNHYYLLNAQPGTYVAVAASYSRGLNVSTTVGNVTGTAKRVFAENILFSEELVRQTQIEITPGKLAVMGSFSFDIEGRMSFAPSAAQFLKAADSIQTHYAKALDPEMESRGATSGIKFYRGVSPTVLNDAGSKQKLLDKAFDHIGAEGWGDLIKAQ